MKDVAAGPGLVTAGQLRFVLAELRMNFLTASGLFRNSPT